MTIPSVPTHSENRTAVATERLNLVVNARHLTGPRTGIEVYMEQLLAALSATGLLDIPAVSWGPLQLGLPNVREVVPAIRPDLWGMRATLWKLWFDQWLSFRAVAPSENGVA